MKKKIIFKPGDMVQVLDEVVDGQTDIGVVMKGTMYWPLSKAHSAGIRALLRPVLVSGKRLWIDERSLLLVESIDE